MNTSMQPISLDKALRPIGDDACRIHGDPVGPHFQNQKAILLPKTSTNHDSSPLEDRNITLFHHETPNARREERPPLACSQAVGFDMKKSLIIGTLIGATEGFLFSPLSKTIVIGAVSGAIFGSMACCFGRCIKKATPAPTTDFTAYEARLGYYSGTITTIKYLFASMGCAVYGGLVILGGHVWNNRDVVNIGNTLCIASGTMIIALTTSRIGMDRFIFKEPPIPPHLIEAFIDGV